jgi:hypothetical protein
MRLSYLDILLGTTMVFVIIYGVYSRSAALPEVEGTALVLRLSAVANTNNQNVGDPSFKIIYTPSSGDRLEVQLNQDNHRLSDFLFVDASQRQKGRIAVHGQPDPGSTIELAVERPVQGFSISLFEHRDIHIAQMTDGEFHELIQWAQQGEELLLVRSSMHSVDYQRKVSDWESNVPLSLNAIRSRALEAAIRNSFYATAWLEAAARALMVSELISPTGSSLDALLNNTGGRFRQACRRVMRHWELHYSVMSVPLKINQWSLSALEVPQSNVLPDRPQDSWNRAKIDDNWGTWIVSDMISSETAPPVVCYWSYGGKPSFVVKEWTLEGNTVKSSVSVQLNEKG